MDVAKPADFIAAMVDASVKKLALEPRDLLVRGAIAGAGVSSFARSTQQRRFLPGSIR